MGALKGYWTTSAVNPDKALDYWEQAISDALIRLNICNAERKGFFADLAVTSFGPIEFSFCVARAHDAIRDRRGIAHNNKDVLYLMNVRRGRLLLKQRDRTAQVICGGSVLVDSTEPYHASFPEDVDCLSIEIPRFWLKDWIVAPADACGQAFSPAAGWGHTLASTLGNLTAESLGGMAVSEVLVAENIATLLALCTGRPCEETTTHRGALLRRIRQSMAERYSDVDLSPDSLAVAHGISKRYLHALFAAVGSCVGAELKEIRLGRAKRLLDDRRCDRLQVAEIALKCGFQDPSHFSRCFTKRFNTSPRGYRRSVHS